MFVHREEAGSLCTYRLAVSDLSNSVTGFWELLLEHGRSFLLIDPRGSRTGVQGPSPSISLWTPSALALHTHETISRL